MFCHKKRFSFVGKCASLAVLAAILCAPAAGAQTVAVTGPAQAGTPALSAQQMTTMRRDMDTALHYKLAPDVLPRLTAALKAIHAAHIQPPGHVGMSLDEQIGMVNKVPGLDPILKTNGFSAHDFVMSLTCVGLTGSLMNVPQTQQTAQMPTPEPQNVALLKAKPDELQALISVLREEQTPQ
ncbi:MAG: hypothetical protein ABF628_10525 [Acetobacter orientalis]|uniref:hypothetical protein n=1 Tax=Acetobacter orientalis TaxID=146474 RepID=UPI0039EC9E7F